MYNGGSTPKEFPPVITILEENNNSNEYQIQESQDYLIEIESKPPVMDDDTPHSLKESFDTPLFQKEEAAQIPLQSEAVIEKIDEVEDQLETSQILKDATGEMKGQLTINAEVKEEND